jgi:hypothetical protein
VNPTDYKGLMLRTKRAYESMRCKPAELTEASGNRPVLDVQGAMSELRTKDDNQLEAETALKWAARAIASYALAVQAGDKSAQTLRFTQGDDFRHEAFEHSAQAGDGGQLLRYLTGEIEKARQEAFAVVVRPTWVPT